MSRGFVLPILGLAVSVVILVAGCGSGDSGPSKAEFLKEGNTVCLKGEKRELKMLQALTRKYGLHASSSAKEKAFIELLSTYEQTTAELGELEPPAGDENSFHRVVEAREETAEKIKADPGTAITSSVQFKKADEVAKAYGLDKCVA